MKKSFEKNSMLDTLILVSILTQQCLDLIKDLVQVLGILGIIAEYNLTPVEASGLHRRLNPAYFSNLATKKPMHFKWHQYTTRGISCEDTLEKSCVSKNDDIHL